ncbi:ester cyclase [Paenibacillus sp. GCM10012306]|uniref:ester cyclase n=1 Tax=Paenibacillus sp. GCM10012306 TaxID=3317342 RepID=UPI00360C8006
MTSLTKTSLDGFHATTTAQNADQLVRNFFKAVNEQNYDEFNTILARNFLSYSLEGMTSLTSTKEYYSKLHETFSNLKFQVHENIGVLVENDLVAVRTIVTGTHTGTYEGVEGTGKDIQTSVSHFFRFRDERLVEQWHLMDTYRILVTIGKIPGVAAGFQQMLGVPESPNGIFQERLGTDFGATRSGRPATREESRAIGRRLYDGVITTGNAKDVDALAEGYMQNTGWTPDGRDIFGHGWAVGRSAMPDGRAIHTHVVAENDRVASLSVWDGTMTASGQPVDFMTVDFLRIEDGLAAEHWDTVDYVRLYQAFGMLPKNI